MKLVFKQVTWAHVTCHACLSGSVRLNSQNALWIEHCFITQIAYHVRKQLVFKEQCTCSCHKMVTDVTWNLNCVEDCALIAQGDRTCAWKTLKWSTTEFVFDQIPPLCPLSHFGVYFCMTKARFATL